MNWDSQNSGTNGFRTLRALAFPVSGQTGYVVGDGGTILKTVDGGVGVKERSESTGQSLAVGFRAQPNPFISFARVPGRGQETFEAFDITGRKVGSYRGERIGEGLPAGVYFLRQEGRRTRPFRIVKIR
jgi:hypothetical protein